MAGGIDYLKLFKRVLTSDKRSGIKRNNVMIKISVLSI